MKQADEPDDFVQDQLAPGDSPGVNFRANQDEYVFEAIGTAPRELTAEDLLSPRRRRVVLPLTLFVATCLSTFWVGYTNWQPLLYDKSKLDWRQGLAYMAAVMAILMAHEMGHFLQTVRYGVSASWPIFLPLPIMVTGTMGAVIVMDPSKANRKQLFDIGIWGPWAGLIVAVPMIWFGIKSAAPDLAPVEPQFGMPLIFKLITAVARPDLQSATIMKNPLFMAGWVGMLVTGLNMLPVSQLDGGHVVYGLFGRHSRTVVRLFIIAAILFIIITEQYNWVLMLVLVLFLGIDHPPTRDDSVPLGPVRWFFGLLSLFIPVFCFTPLLIPS